MLPKQRNFQHIFALIVACAGIVYILSQYGHLFSSVILPFAFACVCAHFLSPVADFLSEKLKIPRGISHVFVVLTFYATLFVGVYILTSRLAGELSGISEYALSFRKSIPQYIEKAESFAKGKLSILPFSNEGAEFFADAIASFLSDLSKKLASKATNFLAEFISFVPNFLLSAAVSVIATCYFSKDLKKIKRFFLFQLPQKTKIFFSACRIQFFATTSKYIGAYLALFALTFFELFSGLLLINGKFAFALALLIAIVDSLPFVGSGIILLPWSLFEWIFASAGRGAALLCLYLVVAVVRQIAEPKILGSFIGLHPLITLFAVYAGAKTLGFFGIFLFPVIAITIKNLNDNGVVNFFKDPPEDRAESLSQTRSKYKKFKKND